MKTPILFALLALAVPCLRAADDYVPGPDSKIQPGVPQGELIKFEFATSKIFPGTSREVTVYVPRQYDATKPACVYVNQDGLQWSANIVFDNLIARGELPVIIGVFVRPGVVKTANSATALDRFNRSYEYDGLGDGYARFLLEEILPAVEARTTADGRAIKLSRSGNDRAIGGSSSGAIAAFTAAWERPDAFSRVFSVVGTYVGLRGGDRYPTLIRKTEPKALRVFLQDGSADNNIYAGDWWMANQTMARALAYAGYEVRHEWGDGGHNGKHGTLLFPDAMRWLWKDWPQPVKTGKFPLERVGPIFLPGEGWELVGERYRLSEGTAVNARGEVFFTDIPASKAYKIGPDGKPVEFIADTKRANGQAFGPDGRLYAVATGTQQVLVYDAAGQASVVASDIAGNDLVVAHNGNLYVTNPPGGAGRDPSRVWLIKPDGAKQIVDTGLKYANGIALSPDQALLYVADYQSHWVYSYVVQADGTLAHKQRYYWLHEPDTDDQAYADGLKVDRNGNLWVATRLGIQVCDQAGRVNVIIPTPNGRCTNLVFGGEKFDTLYASCNEKVYRRKLNVTGANAWDAPHKPVAPKL
ncbi:MAG: SMP-30/gluconolactonase/LRE family protein [Verrucomicrobia bacterium]|nr:SMP-30/gluconolactonase/LRE family protein [Verrucomicrobiota bacterium]